MREHTQLLDHVQLPLLIAIGVAADHFAAIADVVETVAFDKGAGADALARPVMHLPGRQLVMNDLPQELSRGFFEAHQNALVSLDLGVARVVVVGANEDLAAGDDRPAVGLGAKFCGPLDVLAAGHLPFDGGVAVQSVYHVALNGAAEHRVGGLRLGFLGRAGIILAECLAVEIDDRDDRSEYGHGEDGGQEVPQIGTAVHGRILLS